MEVLGRHGLGFLVEQLGLGEFLSWPQRLFRRRRARQGAAALPEASPWGRVLLVLEDLGPTFVKLGQILSTRPDLVPAELARELGRLQDQVPPFPAALACQTVERELGRPMPELFSRFDPEPLAAASIGQVHRASLPDGREVIVKIQRPGIEPIIRADLDILAEIADLLDQRTSLGQYYDLPGLMEEFGTYLREELDYSHEARNAQQMAQRFAGDPTVVIPAVVSPYSTARVLTLQYVPGIKIDDFGRLDQAGYDRSLIARRLLESYLKQILQHGYFHGDPHPGNLAVSPEQAIIFMDFGLMGRLSPRQRQYLAALGLAVVRRDAAGIVRGMQDVGVVRGPLNTDALEFEVERILSRYYHLPMKEFKVGEAFQLVMGLAYRFHIRIPGDFAILGKTLVALEGLVRRLDPELDLVEVVRPYALQLWRQRFRPSRIEEEAVRHWDDYARLARVAPARLRQVLDQAAEGHLQVQFRLAQLERMTGAFATALNRLAVAVVLAGLLIGTSLVISNHPQSILQRLPLGELGFAAGVLAGVWLLISILRTGWF